MQVTVDGQLVDSQFISLSIKALEEAPVAQVGNYSPRFGAYGPEITTSQPNYLFDLNHFQTVVCIDLDLVYELKVEDDAPEGDYSIELTYDLVDAQQLSFSASR